MRLRLLRRLGHDAGAITRMSAWRLRFVNDPALVLEPSASFFSQLAVYVNVFVGRRTAHDLWFTRRLLRSRPTFSKFPDSFGPRSAFGLARSRSFSYSHYFGSVILVPQQQTTTTATKGID